MGIDAKHGLDTTGTTDYAYKLGQCVDHVGGGMVSIVLRRSRTAMGRELYEGLEAWTGIHRHVLGHALVALSVGPQCRKCPVKAAGMCRGLPL